MTNYENLFRGTASFYSKYREGYPSVLFGYLARYFCLDGSGELLDLGCGTGQMAIPLAKYFEQVIAVDPEPEMLEQGKIDADKAGVSNITWILGKAEEVTRQIDPIKLTAMGSSFHWMEQELVLRQVYQATEEGGGLAIVSSPSSPWRLEEGKGWKSVCHELIAKYLGEQRRAGDSYYVKPEGRFEDFIQDSPFKSCEEFIYKYKVERTIESIVGLVFSTSYASKRLFGDRADDFEKELASRLGELYPLGVFEDGTQVQALLVRKNK